MAIFNPKQAGLAEAVVLVHHRDTLHAQRGDPLNHMLGLGGIARARMKYPEIEGIAQRLATGMGRDQRRTAHIEHTVGQQLRDVGGSGKTEQRYHFGAGQHLARQPDGVSHLVTVVRNVMANLGAMHPPCALINSK